MKVSRMAIITTGDSRFQYLCSALRCYIDDLYLFKPPQLHGLGRYYSALRAININRAVWRERYHKNSYAFHQKSLDSEKAIFHLNPRPDLVLQMYGCCSPFHHKATIPYILYLDFTMALAEREWKPWAPFNNEKERIRWYKCENSVYSNAAHVFTLSEYTRNSIIHDYQIPENKVTNVGLSGNFSSTNKIPHKIFNGNTLLFISSNYYRKGGDLVFNAFEKLYRVKPDLRLLVLGSNVPSTPKGVEYFGHVSDELILNRIYADSDIILLPSRCDPSPLTLVEAMHHGIPCIASDSCGIPEIVDNGITGIIVEKDNADQLAESICYLLSNPSLWQQMSNACQCKVMTSMNWDKVASRMFEVITRL